MELESTVVESSTVILLMALEKKVLKSGLSEKDLRERRIIVFMLNN